MNEQQQQALERARATAHLLRVPVTEAFVRGNADIAAAWLNELRRVIAEVADAFPEGGSDDAA